MGKLRMKPGLLDLYRRSDEEVGHALIGSIRAVSREKPYMLANMLYTSNTCALALSVKFPPTPRYSRLSTFEATEASKSSRLILVSKQLRVRKYTQWSYRDTGRGRASRRFQVLGRAVSQQWAPVRSARQSQFAIFPLATL